MLEKIPRPLLYGNILLTVGILLYFANAAFFSVVCLIACLFFFGKSLIHIFQETEEVEAN